jgi:uncharacterized protein (TIGR02594 family)
MPPAGSPPWLLSAWRHIGLRELPGAPTQPRIRSWLQSLGAPWTDDETPWCGVLPAAIFQGLGYKIPPGTTWASARAWAKWGVPLESSVLGAVNVYWRDSPNGWTGHVGFHVGSTEDGRDLLLGANQSNAVTIAPFDRRRLIGRYWPSEAVMSDIALARPIVVATSAASSTNEA